MVREVGPPLVDHVPNLVQRPVGRRHRTHRRRRTSHDFEGVFYQRGRLDHASATVARGVHLTTPQFPDALAELRDMFLGQSFEVVSEVSGGMGGYDLVLAGELSGESGNIPASVSFNADRAVWSLGIRFGSAKRWETVLAWRSYLDGVPVEIKDVEWQARFVRDRLGDMVAAAERDVGIEMKLYEIGRDYMRRHYMHNRS